jgi:hypothetical protein
MLQNFCEGQPEVMYSPGTTFGESLPPATAWSSAWRSEYKKLTTPLIWLIFFTSPTGPANASFWRGKDLLYFRQNMLQITQNKS